MNRKNYHTVAQRAYFAGLIDGEGCISFLSRRARKLATRKMRSYDVWQPDVRIGNTDERIIVWLKKNFGGWSQQLRRAQGNWKPSWQWIATDIRNLIKEIYPYLVLKRRQAEIIIEFPSGRGYGQTGRPEKIKNKQRQLVQEIHRLNKRGRYNKGEQTLFDL